MSFLGRLCIFRKKKARADRDRSPRPWTLPGGVVANPIEPTALMERERLAVAQALEVDPRPVRWYAVPVELTTGGRDPRFRVEWRGKIRTTHGWGEERGARIALSPHGVTSRDTIRHELRHVYGESHDEHAEWSDA